MLWFKKKKFSLTKMSMHIGTTYICNKKTAIKLYDCADLLTVISNYFVYIGTHL